MKSSQDSFESFPSVSALSAENRHYLYRNLPENQRQEFIEQLSIPERMELWAYDHYVRSDGAFVPTKSNEYKDLSESHYRWFLADQTADERQIKHPFIREGLLKMSERAYPDGSFSRMLEVFNGHQGVLAEVKERAEQGETVVIACNHPYLTNIGEVEAGLYCHYDDPNVGDRFGITLNKMLGWLDLASGDAGGEAIPALDSGRMFSDVFCSVARSKSSKNLRLDEYANDYNPSAIRPLIRKMKKGMILVTAPSGALDVPGESGILMNQVEPITAKILSGYCYGALPVRTWKDPTSGELSVTMADEIVPLNSEDDVHQMMAGMEEPYSSLVNGKGPDNISVHYDFPLRQAV